MTAGYVPACRLRIRQHKPEGKRRPDRRRLRACNVSAILLANRPYGTAKILDLLIAFAMVATLSHAAAFLNVNKQT